MRTITSKTVLIACVLLISLLAVSQAFAEVPGAVGFKSSKSETTGNTIKKDTSKNTSKKEDVASKDERHSKKKVKVFFYLNNNCSSVIAVKKISRGKTLGASMPSVPHMEGFEFLGWETRGGCEFTSCTVITHNTHVYAKWKHVCEVPDDPDPHDPDDPDPNDPDPNDPDDSDDPNDPDPDDPNDSDPNEPDPNDPDPGDPPDDSKDPDNPDDPNPNDSDQDDSKDTEDLEPNDPDTNEPDPIAPNQEPTNPKPINPDSNPGTDDPVESDPGNSSQPEPNSPSEPKPSDQDTPDQHDVPPPTTKRKEPVLQDTQTVDPVVSIQIINDPDYSQINQDSQSDNQNDISGAPAITANPATRTSSEDTSSEDISLQKTNEENNQTSESAPKENANNITPKTTNITAPKTPQYGGSPGVVVEAKSWSIASLVSATMGMCVFGAHVLLFALDRFRSRNANISRQRRFVVDGPVLAFSALLAAGTSGMMFLSQDFEGTMIAADAMAFVLVLPIFIQLLLPIVAAANRNRIED